MRICITRSERFSYSETFIRDQIAQLSKVAQVFTIHSGRLPERNEDGTLLSSRLFWVLHKIVKTLTGERNNFFGNYGIRKFLQQNKIDVVIANYGLAASHLMPICRSINIPLISIFHGHDATDKKLLKQYGKKYRMLFNDAAFVVVVSNEMRDSIVAMGAPPEKVKVISCGVDLQKFKPLNQAAKEKIFLAVGRLIPKKGPIYTINAFYKVWKKHPEARLIFVGKKAGLYKDCVQLVSSLEIENAVEFTGILQPAEIAQLMQRALAFVQHSVRAANGDTEGTPVSILEAAASGLPIVSTLHGGIKDAVLHNVSGFLVPEGDIDAMAHFMEILFDDPNVAAKMGEEGRQHIIRNYAQDSQIEKLFHLAQQAVRYD